MKRFTYIVILFLSFWLVSCTENRSVFSGNSSPAHVATLSPKEYVFWCQNKDNGLKKSKELGDITYSLLYKPVEYVVCTEQQTETILASDLNKKAQELDGLDYYDFKIQLVSENQELLKYQVGSVAEYQARLNYFAFDMQKDIKIIEGQDTNSCVLFHFERTFDIAPYATFVVGFPKSKKPTDTKTFFYQDNVFHKGIIKIAFTKEELIQIPKLQTI